METAQKPFQINDSIYYATDKINRFVICWWEIVDEKKNQFKGTNGKVALEMGQQQKSRIELIRDFPFVELSLERLKMIGEQNGMPLSLFENSFASERARRVRACETRKRRIKSMQSACFCYWNGNNHILMPHIQSTPSSLSALVMPSSWAARLETNNNNKMNDHFNYIVRFIYTRFVRRNRSISVTVCGWLHISDVPHSHDRRKLQPTTMSNNNS